MLDLKTIGFHTDGLPFDGGTLERRALGGSETALIQAARALSDMGHRVTVFNHCQRPGIYHGVEYLPTRAFPSKAAGTRFDVFIVSRFADFFTIPFQAGLKVLWNHDTLDRPRWLSNFTDQIDLMFVLSRFHLDNFLTHMPDLDGRLLITRNGIDIDLIDLAAKGIVKDPNKVIYASRPERGLKVLLENIWPDIIASRPEMKLFICGYEVGRTGLAPGLTQLYQYLDRVVERSANVIPLGALAKEDYYRHLAESALMLYPCTFPEISCIAALEAQACRTPILATDAFALSETIVVPEFKVPGRPGSTGYDWEYVARACWFLDHPEIAADKAHQARIALEEWYTWPKITAEWDRAFNLYLKSKKAGANR
jgi:glycosyltransferase involved in cell wall biosynthesis